MTLKGLRGKLVLVLTLNIFLFALFEYCRSLVRRNDENMILEYHELGVQMFNSFYTPSVAIKTLSWPLHKS